MSELIDALKTAFSSKASSPDMILVAPWFYDYMRLSEKWARKTGKVGGMSYRRFKAWSNRQLTK